MKTTFMTILLISFFGLTLLYAEEKIQKQAVKETLELNKMSNDDLIKKARSLFNEAYSSFYVQLRGMYAHEVLIAKAHEETSAIVISEKPVQKKEALEGTDFLESKKAISESAKSRVESFKNRLERMNIEKNLIDKMIKNSEKALSAAVNFINTVEEIHLFQLEIVWRVEDGTISQDKAPDFLNAQKMDEQKRKIIDLQNIIKLKKEAAQKNMETLISDIEKIGKDLIEAKAHQSSVEEDYSYELKRRTLEKEFVEQSSEKLIALILNLEEEHVWIKGSFNLSQGRFLDKKTYADQIHQEIESTTPPEPFVQKGVIQAEEMEQVTKLIESVISFHVEHKKKLEKFGMTLQAVIKHGEIFYGDAIVLTEHLFKMHIIATILEQAERDGKIQVDAIPENSRPAILAKSSHTVSELISETMSVIGKTKEQLEKNDDNIKKSDEARKEARGQLANFKKSYESALQAQKWKANLKDLTAKDIVIGFKENSEKLVKNKEVLKNAQTEYKKANETVARIRHKFESLNDPMLRLARQESFKEKRTIMKTLYEIAEFELPADLALNAAKNLDKSANAKDSDSGASHESGTKEKTKNADVSSRPSLESETDAYQNLLSARSRIIGEQIKQRKSLLQALENLDKKIDGYVAALHESEKLAAQQHASAVELKKRLGRSELKANEIPEGITEALKPDALYEIEKKLAAKLNYQAFIRQEIEKLGRHDEPLEKTQKLISDIQELVGKRLDILQDLKKLEEIFERKRDMLSATEGKSLEQKSLRHMDDEDTTAEFLVSFVPSERAKSLTDLLQAYYMDLTELEQKRKILATQKEFVDDLIQLSEQEKTFDSKILPYLSKQIDRLKLDEEEEWLKIRVQLMPEKAQELIAAFEAKTKLRIPTPPPLIEKYKQEIVDKAVDQLFNERIENLAAGKWIDLFQQRLSRTGIDAEIGKYQDWLGAMNSKFSAIDRGIWNLTGYPPVELAKLANDEQSGTYENKLRLSKGRIGVLREDRHQVFREAVIKVAARLAIILLFATLTSIVFGALVNRVLKKYQKSGNQKGFSTVSLLPLVKTIFIFFIWIIAIISCLSTLGFNVGAIIAGLGIGGFAIAMASKEMLSDIIGGISILLAKSFQIGDAILFKGEKAIVEDIGLRYTKLRQKATSFQVTAPNSLLAQTEAINTSSAKQYFVNIDLPLSIRNSMEKIREATELITQVVDENPETKLKNLKFKGFDNYAFLLSFRYIVLNYSLRHTMRTQIHSEIVGQFEKNGIEIAAVPYTDINQ